MGTILDKLEYLRETKGKIRDSIEDMGVPVEERDTFRSYADKIRRIEKGEGNGGTPPPVTVEPLDPYEVYRDTRPADWMPMPEVVRENEIYFLYLASPPAENYAGFTVTCNGEYTVEYGIVENGVFVPQHAETRPSGEPYQNAFLYGETTGVFTEDGLEQMMLRVSGDGIGTFVYRGNWRAVDILGKCPDCTGFNVAGSPQLRYFSLQGTNQISTFMNMNMFAKCHSLVAVLELDTSNGINFSYMFDSCFSLIAIPELDTANGTIFSGMFASCYSLITIPDLDTSNGTNFSFMFNSCISLTKIPALNTSNSTNFSFMFNSCYFLTTITWLNTSNGADFSLMFRSCFSLSTIPWLNTSSGTDFSYMFHSCYSLTTIPELDTSNGTNFSSMFCGCQSLKTIPELDTSNGADFSSMFYGCQSLTTIPELDTSNGASFLGMFYGCQSLTTIPELDTSNGTSFSGMFTNCFSLTKIPALNTSNSTNFSFMFNSCYSLTTIPKLDTSNGTNFSYMFYNCPALVSIPKLDVGCNASNEQFSLYGCHSLTNLILVNMQETWSSDLDVSSTALPRQAVLNLFDALPTVENTCTIYVGGTPAANDLTSEDIAIAQAKNWTVQR